MAGVNRVRYARTRDAVDIAYATLGDGPPLLVLRPILRLSVDHPLDESPDLELPKLAEKHLVVVWDPRGFGLSETSEPCYTVDSSLRRYVGGGGCACA
jgi:pimeloyl-ACP methyl ester carboxylesterase